MQQKTRKSYNKMKNEFYKKFRSGIVPIAQRQEKTRKIYLALAIAGYIVLWTLTALFAYFVIVLPQLNGKVFTGEELKGSVYIILSGLIAPYIIQQWLTNKIDKKIKKQIMPCVCRCIGNLTWDSKFYENKQVMASAKLIPKDYNGVVVDDVFTGEYNDVAIDIVEAKYTKTTGFGKNRRTITYFEGIFVVLEMNKNFKSNTVILPDKLIKKEPVGLKHTTLEDVVFEKKYDVFTTDEIEARYLITTSFMERLNEMKTAFKAAKVRCSFYEQKLIIGFEIPEDSFSIVSLFAPTDDHKAYFQMFEEFLSIVKLIDHFKLNERTGL